MNRNTLLFLAFFTVCSAVGAEASAQGRAAQTVPSRQGLFVEGGGWYTGAYGHGWFRAEVGIHLARLARADLYLQIPLMFTNYGYSNSVGNYGWWGLALIPGVRGEWTMLNRKGDLALYLEGGLGFATFGWNGPAGTPYDGRSDTRGIARAGLGVSYTAPFGLLVSVQPVGGGGMFGAGGGGFYDASLMLGYRWQ